MAGTPSLWEFVPRGDAGISVGGAGSFEESLEVAL